MQSELEIQALPAWLESYEEFADTNKPLPLMDLLKDSFFYPASGLDAWPIKYLSGNFYSFVYADYGIPESQLLNGLNFKGYQLVLTRKINIQNELPPNLTVPFNAKNIPDEIEVKTPYAYWICAKKISNDIAGAEMFSLLFLSFEGVKTYKNLYVQNKVASKALAIIQPGTGFGGNWTNFRDPSGDLANCVLNTMAAKPKYLVTGGEAGALIDKADWPVYKNKIATVNAYLHDGFVIFKR